MQRLSRRQWPLAIKLSLAMTAIIMVMVFSITLLSIRREQRSFRSEQERKAALLLDTLTVYTSDALYFLDADFLKEAMANLGETDIVQVGRIYDRDGRIIADTQATPASEFSRQINPLGRQLIDLDSTYFDWQQQYLIAGRRVRIGGQTLGAISVQLSTTALQERMREVRNEGIIVALVVILSGILVSLAVSQSITEPLRRLTTATREVAAGNLTQKIEVKSGDEIGTLAGSFNTMIDQLRSTIGNLKRSEEEARQARDVALEASRLKSEFLATMSHELRTPLNAIIGFSQVITMGLTGEISPTTKDRVTRIHTNSQRLLALIDDILDLSKIEARRVELVRTPFKPADLLTEVDRTMRQQATDKGISLSTELDPLLPLTLLGDTKRLGQILFNLVSNAIKFTEQGKVNIALKRLTSPEWQIIVTDTGAGIPPHAQEYIFDKFRQVDSSTRRTHGGTGLGLAIVKELAMLMGGNVAVKSILKVGSTFTVTLPLELPVEEPTGTKVTVT